MADQEDYRSWARHFGKSTLHPDVISEFHRAGVAKAPVIKRDMLHTRTTLDGLTVNFAAPELFPTEEEVGAGAGILYGIALHLSGSRVYRGWLPYGIMPDDSRASLQKRLGKPGRSNDEEAWDEWILDGLEVTVTYSKDFNSLEALAVYLPEAT
jgi:hypothetical protein